MNEAHGHVRGPGALQPCTYLDIDRASNRYKSPFFQSWSLAAPERFPSQGHRIPYDTSSPPMQHWVENHTKRVQRSLHRSGCHAGGLILYEGVMPQISYAIHRDFNFISVQMPYRHNQGNGVGAHMDTGVVA